MKSPPEVAAGIATVDVTPPVGIELEGYHRPAPSQGCLDGLSATALVLASAQVTAVLLSVDLVGMLPAHVAQVRQEVGRALSIGPGQVMVLFTHTHSGPTTGDRTRRGRLYRRELHDRLVRAAREASMGLQPCTVAWGVTHACIGVNRREDGPGGRVRMGVNPQGPVDDRIGVLRIDSAASGEPLGLLVICTAHANVLKRDSSLISADYPGWTRRLLSTAVGCPTVVAIGAAGDCNARWRSSVQDLRRMAQAIGGAVLQLLPELEPRPLSRLWMGSTVLPMGLLPLPDPEQAQALAHAAVVEWEIDPNPWLKAVARARQLPQPLSLDLEVQALQINEGFFAGIPMEPFTGIALEVKRRLQNDLAFLGGCTNGWIGYLPTTEEYPRGGYEVEWLPVVYGYEAGYLMPAHPETAERVVAAVVGLAGQAQLGT